VSGGDPRFAAWLLEDTGIDAQALGANALVRAVAQRAAAAVTDEIVQHGTIPAAWDAGAAVPAAVLEAYWSHLMATADERQALIDALVVPETWFFREREAFAALARLGRERLARQPGEVLRVLSVPCSSGEEPYSAAMALLDAGLNAEQFGIDAIDISAASIAAAERGVYGRNAFRGEGLAFREQHFEAVQGGWRINLDARRPVTFERANLFDWLAGHPVRYDFIFCRNVLIYFDRTAQDRAMTLLRARLADGGMIFVGPAETGVMMRHEMVSAYIPLAFGFRQPDENEMSQRVPVPEPVPLPLKPLHLVPAVKAVAAASASVVPASWAVSAKPARAQHVIRPMANVSAPVKPASATGAPIDSLTEARRLADAGELDEAHRLALQATQSTTPNADAWYLLGLIVDAQGDVDQARDHYRKAVYLEPAHYEALTHLAALLEVQGDGDGARRLMRRAERAAPRTPYHGGTDV
jgi:chemotaxis protein methyltransferase WspC